MYKMHFSQLLLHNGIIYALRTSKRYIVRGFIGGQMVLQWRPQLFNENKPQMMYIFELLRTCMMYLTTHYGHLLTLVASNGLHFQTKLIFSCKKCIFFTTFTSVLHKICLEDLKNVYYQGGSLEAKWSSNGGHNVKSNKTLHDAYF